MDKINSTVGMLLEHVALERRITLSSGGGSGAGRLQDAYTTGTSDSADDDSRGEQMIDQTRWLDTEIAVGSIVSIMVVAAVVAVWISCNRRRRRVQSTIHEAENGTTVEGMVHHVHTLHEVKEVPCRKTSALRPPLIKVGKGGDAGQKQAYAVPTVASTPDPTRDPKDSPQLVAGVGPWEPYFLGLPGRPTRARRRSVSLRSGDDEGSSEEGFDPARTPSPAPTLSPEDADGEVSRKRSVTFKPLVEEVQFLAK